MFCYRSCPRRARLSLVRHRCGHSRHPCRSLRLPRRSDCRRNHPRRRKSRHPQQLRRRCCWHHPRRCLHRRSCHRLCRHLRSPHLRRFRRRRPGSRCRRRNHPRRQSRRQRRQQDRRLLCTLRCHRTPCRSRRAFHCGCDSLKAKWRLFGLRSRSQGRAHRVDSPPTLPEEWSCSCSFVPAWASCF